MTNPVVLVLFQILLVIGLSRLVGLGFRSIRQPLVIGEIVAGIMLGPSLFGWVAPDLAAAVFPASTIPFLNVLSQVGLIFFMFLIGLELNPKYLRGQIETAVLTSHVSIIVPLSLGSLLALFLYPLVSSANVSFTAFALFLGAAMSITAFPVLARIITENNLQGSRLGTLALTCAAVDDVTAWCILALAIAVTRTNSMVAALPTLFEAAFYIGFMLTIGRWFLKRLAKFYERTGSLSQLTLAGIYMGVVASALITELIGIHLIFGAFLLGAAMPKNEGLTRELAEKTEDFVLTFLLPIFFAYSGLRTQVGLLNRPELWLLCGMRGVGSDRRQVRRHLRRRTGLRHEFAGCLGVGLADEHARIDRADCVEYWLELGRNLAAVVHDAGDHGIGHHLHDFAAAGMDLSEAVDPARSGRIPHGSDRRSWQFYLSGAGSGRQSYDSRGLDSISSSDRRNGSANGDR